MDLRSRGDCCRAPIGNDRGRVWRDDTCARQHDRDSVRNRAHRTRLLREVLLEVEQRAVNALSVMPANVADLVSEADFVHLLGYLLSQRVEQAAK